MTFTTQVKKTAMHAAIGLALSVSAGAVMADQAKNYVLGDSGQITADANSDINFSESNGHYIVNLAQGGLCFSVDQSTPLTITAGGKSIEIGEFDVSESGDISGMVAVDETGIYAGSTASCDGVSSVTTTGNGLFGLGADGTVLAVAGLWFSLALLWDDGDDDPVEIPPEPQEETPPPAPVAGGGGGSAGGGGGAGGGGVTPPTPAPPRSPS